MNHPLPDNILKCMSKKDRPKGNAGITHSECEEKAVAKHEREIHDQIAAYLRISSIAFCHARMDKKSTMTPGWPDFTFAVNGRAIGCEVKTAIGKLTEDQKTCHQFMESNGWRIWVVRSFEEFVGEYLAVRQIKTMPWPHPPLI